MTLIFLLAGATLLLAGCGSGRSSGSDSRAQHSSGAPVRGHPPSTLWITAAHATEIRVLRGLLQGVVYQLATRTGRRDSEFFSRGVWKSADETCWRCNVGPGTAAAVLWRTGHWRRNWLLKLAEETFDHSIRVHERPDGSFGPALGAEANDVISTMFFGLELGMAYHELAPALGHTRALVWRSALERAAAYLAEKMGGVYINGNINLGTATVLRFAAEATGDPRWLTAFRQELAFTLHPSATAKAQGFGLRLTVKPTTSSYSNGGGYLAERGTSSAGFDPEYTELQDDIAARLYTIDKGTESVRLLNALTNVLLPRVDSTYRLHTFGGSRHGAPHSVVPFTTSALPILAFEQGRRDLARRAVGQLTRIRYELGNAIRFPYKNSYRYVSLQATALAVLAPQTPIASGTG
jgi:hypothetical protein